MRRFNTAGPCNPEWHYMVPPEQRLPPARGLVAQHGYFVVHAPRQTGKTTTLRALAHALVAEGTHAALHVSIEAAKVALDDYGAAEGIILAEITVRASIDLPEALRPPSPWPAAEDGSRLRLGLAGWARACPRPVALFVDEIDALQGQSLLSVLGQLRAGFNDRPAEFPSSVALIGLRDVRDYKAASGGDPTRLGTSSPFNIKVKSLRIGDFDRDEVESLYHQHTAETAQPFTPAALDRAWELTEGQPWLVNALAAQVVEETVLPPEPITAAHLDEAKERLVLARQTHLDSLVARLHEPRVRRVVAPLLEGTFAGADETYDDDVRYVRDLGLVAAVRPVRIANPIYREIVARVLATAAEEQVVIDDPRAFVRADGRLDLEHLLREFAAFWVEHGEVLSASLSYHEVAPQLVLMAYLQRVVNGGGYIDREYGVGRGRIDLLVRWPYVEAGKRRWQRLALELKVWRDGQPDPLDKGLAQLDGYLERLGLDEGVLVLFDRRRAAPPIAKRTATERATTSSGRGVLVWRG